MKKYFNKVMLDSGAFTAHRKGVEIDLDTYIGYCLDHAKLVDIAVALDVIPGGVHNVSLIDAAEQSVANAIRMREAGVKTMPVFHLGEDYKYLDRYVDEGFTWIGIGGLARVVNAKTILQIKGAFRHLGKRAKRLRFHCFGVTSPPTLYAAPWASSDSLSWCLAASYGWVYVPKAAGYVEPPAIVQFSRWETRREGQQLSKGKAQNHFDGFGDYTKKLIAKYLRTTFKGATPDLMASCRLSRAAANAAYYEKLESNYREAVREDFDFYLTMPGDIKWGANALRLAGVRSCLISYYNLLEKRNLTLEQVVKGNWDG